MCNVLNLHINNIVCLCSFFTADIDLYSAPYVGADSFILAEGEQVTVVGYLNNEQYYEVVYEDTVYYLPKDDLSESFRDSNT